MHYFVICQPPQITRMLKANWLFKQANQDKIELTVLDQASVLDSQIIQHANAAYYRA